ncbi:MAG: hypothetical protein ABFE01_07415 [Phycisphaerales bacterium]
MLRRDPIDPPFGAAYQPPTEQPQEKPTIGQRIVAAVQSKTAEIDGVPFGEVATKLIREQGLVPIGVEILRFALKNVPGGLGGVRTSREPWNPTKHVGLPTETVVREYLRAQPDSAGHQRIHLIANNVNIGAIGLTLARSCLRKCARTAAGEEMLKAAEARAPENIVEGAITK